MLQQPAIKRLLVAIPVIWFMVSAIFLLSRLLPGTYGETQLLSPEAGFYGKSLQTDRTAAYQQLLQRTGQDLPLFYISIAPLSEVHTATTFSYLVPDLEWHGTRNQYHHWAAALLTGHLGVSFTNSQPVSALIADAAGNTFLILLVSMVLTSVLAFYAGIAMVQDTGKKWRKPMLALLVLLDSIPLFVLCLLLLLLLANPDAWQLFPVFGLGLNLHDTQSNWVTQASYMVLPVACLVLANLPYLTNQVYTSLTGTLQAGYIKTARAKGLPHAKVVTRHALRNALLPVITTLSDMLPALFAGSVVIETIFAIPGVGRLLVSSVLSRDFPVIIGIVIVVALIKMVSHIVADVAYSAADPRIRARTA
ncbi:ABC transporter permease [Pontibacter sp. Tf4]|uniref:ABC transporter permease n=1 Tax=Pontibacter sp. Tf4 TaxID=2761620 RepID=UPI00162780BB|nr:ABC transporter permease [Pontibacter sp. Tf4]MBB6611975.1 ABC transporter permease [Pontibacter sp. Tf4]